jgi:hypothetical protein
MWKAVEIGKMGGCLEISNMTKYKNSKLFVIGN